MIYKLLELRSYMIDENDEVYNMLQEIPAFDEFEQTNQFHGKTKLEVKDEVIKMMNFAYGFNNDEDNPKCENFVLYADNRPVAIGGLMLEMSNFWQRHRGHIWFKTRPSRRNKGHATMLVRLMCERAKEFNIKQLFAQCDIRNHASNKVLLNNNFIGYVNPLCPDWTDTNFYKKII